MQDGPFKAPAHVPPVAGSIGPQIIERLRRRELPQMVDWIDPILLAKIVVRSIISSTLGQYTDQRLMQAASDNATETELEARYNYSGERTPKPGETREAIAAADQAVKAAAMTPDSDDGDAIWVDYIADLGDGFEATYAMAYLMAPDYLDVPKLDRTGYSEHLKAGELLIMGGDQVYPDATKQAYQERLIDPYDWAFSTEVPQRKVFAIPGNHDWYDGLSSFSALFCSARDRISLGFGRQIGGWRCHQHRSYFAIKLPHNWWIWGPDIQLADNLDDSQRDYFYTMSKQATEGHKIILFLAEPSWLHKNYDNMHEITMLARQNGAKILAVVAGDWHHYSRYASKDLGVQFITCGGGGAFAHATHGLKRNLEINWAKLTGADAVKSDPADTEKFNRMERSAVKAGGKDFTEARFPISADEPAVATSDDATAQNPRVKPVPKEKISTTRYNCAATHIYPSQSKSRMLGLKNLVLPFRNRSFAVLMGVVYFVYAWAFAAADPRQSPILLKLGKSAGVESVAAKSMADGAAAQAGLLKARLDALEKEPGGTTNPMAIKARDDLQLALATAKAASEFAKAIDDRKKSLAGEAVTNAESEMKKIDLQTGSLGDKLWSVVKVLVSGTLEEKLSLKGLFVAAEQSPPFFFLLMGLWVGLIYFVDLPASWLGMIGKVAIGTVHFAAHLYALLIVSWLANGTALPWMGLASYLWPDSHSLAPDIVRVTWTFLTTLFIGGLLGAFVTGLYFALASTLANMHTDYAFASLGIKDYKHFLRIKLQPDKATIYPIALDTVPGRKGWRWELERGETRPAHNPQIMPVEPLAPHLIEPPIEIYAEAVRS